MKIGYMCSTAYDLDFCKDNADHVELYGSVEALKENCECWEECGIVQVEIKKKDIIETGLF